MPDQSSTISCQTAVESSMNDAPPKAERQDVESQPCTGTTDHWQELGLRKPTNMWEKRALLFTPSWFSINMGTGIVSILLHQLPYQFSGLQIISIVIFVLNIFLFLAFLGLSLTRYLIWPKVFGMMLTHPTQAFFLGTFSMGFATIVNMVAFVGIPAFGQGFVVFAWVLWWLDAVTSLLVNMGVLFVLFTYQQQSLQTLNAVWLLPAVSPIVSAATGSIVASYLTSSHARLTIIISYILFGTGFPVAVLLMALYMYRLSLEKLPPAAVIVSCFLPLGPCGQGAFALLNLSKDVLRMSQESGDFLGGRSLYTPEEARILALGIYGATIPIALVLWGFGLFWLVIAVAAITKTTFEDGFPFNIGWWGFTFPLGVFTTATLALGEQLDSQAFSILGTIFTGCLVVLWLYVGVRSMVRAWTGLLFAAPCLGEVGKAL